MRRRHLHLRPLAAAAAMIILLLTPPPALAASNELTAAPSEAPLVLMGAPAILRLPPNASPSRPDDARLADLLLRYQPRFLRSLGHECHAGCRGHAALMRSIMTSLLQHVFVRLTTGFMISPRYGGAPPPPPPPSNKRRGSRHDSAPAPTA